jgi:Ni,Fe-hydrogenase III small subunit/NAD-dependent dihydropyrimidine dehydrogenase PreA subunit
MFTIFRERCRQGYRTHPFPKKEPVLPERFRGLPQIDAGRCPPDCDDCAGRCPTEAISRHQEKPVIDLGRCVFCADCPACPHGAVSFTNDYRLAVRERSDLHLAGETLVLAKALEDKMLGLFGRSLKLRQVSAGGCNGCEADVNVLGTLVFDLGRFGIQFVASPRHADGMLVTGPVTANMHAALLSTWEAIPGPKLVIAAGACAIAGGPYRNSPEVNNGLEGILPVDLYIPGCPPHPYTTLDGLLRLLDKRERT